MNFVIQILKVTCLKTLMLFTKLITSVFAKTIFHKGNNKQKKRGKLSQCVTNLMHLNTEQGIIFRRTDFNKLTP